MPLLANHGSSKHASSRFQRGKASRNQSKTLAGEDTHFAGRAAPAHRANPGGGLRGLGGSPGGGRGLSA
jgi:hypothetical protein